MTKRASTLVIGGSVRPQRICPEVVAWVAAVGRDHIGGVFETVDLKDWPLPMDDEPEIPATGVYVQAHTRAWSEMIRASGAVIFVTPQYNWGYPAPLKNALDHLYSEWADKPAMIVTYGGHGGGKCGEQLRSVLEGLHMRLTATTPMFTLSPMRIKANAGEVVPAEEFAAHLSVLRGGLAELALAQASQAPVRG